MNTLIMAKGESLKRLNELDKYNIDECILVNGFRDELNMKFIWDYIKDKKIIHLMANQNNPPCYLHKRQYQKLNLEYCIVNREKSNLKSYKIKYNVNDHPAKIAVESYDIGIEVKYLPEDIQKGGYIDEIKSLWASSGLLALLYASWYLKRNPIYMIGQDFHENRYLVKKRRHNVSDDGWELTYTAEMKNKMRNWMKYWVKKTPDTNYIIISNCLEETKNKIINGNKNVKFI